MAFKKKNKPNINQLKNRSDFCRSVVIKYFFTKTTQSSKNFISLLHDSVQMPFEFYAEQKGEIERSCYFVSDARNPVVDVKILATVWSEQAVDGNIK
ncbi:MAG: hypothetical protein LBS09_09060 [Bacteroidales bacterium]|jgi:hypothetical protein|nr:hypothetical protein [Bacteroidales bacterium]